MNDLDYTMDFVVKVPAGINVMVGTINDGEVSVENEGGVRQQHQWWH